MVSKRIITVICCLALITCAFGLSSCSGSGSTGLPVLDAFLFGTWRSSTITVYAYLLIFTSAALYSVTMDGQPIESGTWATSNGILTMTPNGGENVWSRDYQGSSDNLTVSTTINGETYTDHYVRQTD